MARLRVNRNQLERPAFREPVLHHLPLAGIRIGARALLRWRRRRFSFFNGGREFVINDPREQRFVCVDRRH